MDKKHFYEGMKPLPTDFDLLQKNTEDADGAIPLSLSGAGILSGLTLTKQQRDGKAEIPVNHGTAVTGKGNILVVDSSITHKHNVVEITNAAANAATTYLYVYLERAYTETTTLNIRNESVWDERTYSARAVLVADNQKDVYAQGHEAVLLGRLNKATGVLDTEGVKYATGWGSLHSSLRSTLMAMVFPSHSIYVQYPHQKSPIDLYPYIEWEDITSIYDGAFFRAYKSGLSGRFSEYNNGGLLSYSLQQDAGRRITGQFEAAHANYASGAFSHVAITGNKVARGSGLPPDRISFDSRDSWGSSHTAPEFRPLNHAIKIWRSKGIKADYNFAGAVGNGTSGGQGSGGQGSAAPSLYYTKAQTDHLLGYKATVTALTALRGDVYDKSAIDTKFRQVSGSVPDLSGYLHVKKGAYDLNYDGEFIDMDADFNGAYNGGYGVNLTITKCKNARAVPIFGHRTCTDFAQDKSSVGNDTLLHIPVVVGTNKFWLAKKSFGFTFAIEYVGSTAPNMMNPPTAEIESKSGITGAVPVKNLGTKTYNSRTYSYFLARVDYKLDADFANPAIGIVLNFDSAKMTSKMEIIAYNGYVFEGLTSARYNAADLTTNFHFPANSKFDHRTFDDTTDGDTLVAGYRHNEADNKEVRLPANVKISRENLDSGVAHKVGYDRNLEQLSTIYVGEYNSQSVSWTTFDRDSQIMDAANPLAHTMAADHELMTFNFSENFPAGWFVFRFRIITTVDCSLIVANTDSHGDGVEGKYSYRYFDDTTRAYPRISKANKSFFARCVAGDNRIDVFMVNNGKDLLFKDSKSVNFALAGNSESYVFAKTICGYHLLDDPAVRAGKNPEQVIGNKLVIKLQTWGKAVPNLQTNSFVEFKREISA